MTHPDPLSSLLGAVTALHEAITRMAETEKGERRGIADLPRDGPEQGPEGPDPGDVLPGEAMLAEGRDRLGRLGQEVRLLHREVGRVLRVAQSTSSRLDAHRNDTLVVLRDLFKLVRRAMWGERSGEFWSEATERIDEERARQVAEHGYDAEHDDRHPRGFLAVAGAGLAMVGTSWWVNGSQVPPVMAEKHRDESRIRRLEIAGALIAAELDRELRREAWRQGEMFKS